MELFKITLSIIDAIGSMATAIALIITLSKYRKKLKVKGGFLIKKADTYLISIHNNTLFDNEIKSILFCKGNPKNIWTESTIFYSLNFSDYDFALNPNTKNIVIPQGTSIEVPVSCKCIACNYKKIGEALGKPFDKICVLIKDKRGYSYCIKTDANIDSFRILSE